MADVSCLCSAECCNVQQSKEQEPEHWKQASKTLAGKGWRHGQELQVYMSNIFMIGCIEDAAEPLEADPAGEKKMATPCERVLCPLF